ncbi:MAG: VOC family protein [Gammaproteobacteria bacterium]|nr:VOC family protein [Pseudomonadales bacterium]MCP5346598.1 VOC family protein [Pseudomonadales bacterium]
MPKVKTHLMFQGEAQQAIDLYSSLFSDFTVGATENYGADEGVPEGTLKLAEVTFAGHELIILNSPPVHDFTFTPAMSLFVDFETEPELETAFAKLSEDGKVMMPPGDYGFSRRFGWLTDRFGVSWQLNLPA